jgi:hypothetical protein
MQADDYLISSGAGMKRAEHGSQIKGDADAQPRPVPETSEDRADAREKPEQLRKNREDLGVEDDHKTKDMEQGNRGTFP